MPRIYPNCYISALLEVIITVVILIMSN